MKEYVFYLRLKKPSPNAVNIEQSYYSQIRELADEKVPQWDLEWATARLMETTRTSGGELLLSEFEVVAYEPYSAHARASMSGVWGGSSTFAYQRAMYLEKRQRASGPLPGLLRLEEYFVVDGDPHAVDGRPLGFAQMEDAARYVDTVFLHEPLRQRRSRVKVVPVYMWEREA